MQKTDVLEQTIKIKESRCLKFGGNLSIFIRVVVSFVETLIVERLNIQPHDKTILGFQQ